MKWIVIGWDHLIHVSKDLWDWRISLAFCIRGKCMKLMMTPAAKTVALFNILPRGGNYHSARSKWTVLHGCVGFLWEPLFWKISSREKMHPDFGGRKKDCPYELLSFLNAQTLANDDSVHLCWHWISTHVEDIQWFPSFSNTYITHSPGPLLNPHFFSSTLRMSKILYNEWRILYGFRSLNSFTHIILTTM